jgi:type I restriction enzyme, S subunit
MCKSVDSELGMIPEGWKVGTLRDITNNKTAKVKERNDVKVLSPVTSGELVLSEEYFTKQVFSSSIAKYKIVNKGDFAYNPARVNIGSIGRNEFDFDGCVSPVYVVFSVLDGYENYFDLFRKTDFFKDSVASLAIGGVRQSLSYDDLSLIETIIPSKNIVEKFNNLYNQMKKTIKANKLENSRLSLLRDTLLPRLMSGEIEVPE